MFAIVSVQAGPHLLFTRDFDIVLKLERHFFNGKHVDPIYITSLISLQILHILAFLQSSFSLTSFCPFKILRKSS